ncbi:N-acetyltransferase [Mycolicibacter terrae]|uniref:Lysine N-acyltransferase MbtK n=3 Tax=Mycobacteriaceae TaxID=1762 RepID=A0A1A2P2Q6_MYCSD|nr:siderophore biosynthesis protein [Mycolicibacter sinensis]OBI29796.1 siderophore biosynthesis protein [Mycolicibacter sinensis]RRR39943.1 N-acetyltransferase [Mycolicibacter terrae]
MSSLMPRQRPDVTDEVRTVPPPPLPVLAEPYSIRFADPAGDAEMISEWMNRPHLEATWDYAYPADEWRRHLEIQFEGSYSRPYVYSVDGRPLGYMELFRAAQDDISTVYDAHPYDVGLHGAMADPDMVEKGHGANIFGPLVSSIFRAEPQCRRIIGDAHAAGSYGRRFWERRGGVFLGEHYMAKWDQQIALFAWPRDPQDVPAYRRTS